MNIRKLSVEKVLIALISAGFIIWSAVFIYSSSFIAVDGNRYFALFDDAMISMRYAWNFSHGSGLVWNPGEYVQGYTNLLMTLLMSFATFIFGKSAAVLFIQISGAVFILAIAYLSMKITGIITRDADPRHRSLVGVLSFLCAVSYYPLVYWSLMGMETGLLALLVTAGVWAALTYGIGGKPRHLFLTALYLGLAYLTRNDSIIFAMLVWVYLVWEIPMMRTSRAGMYRLLSATAVYFLFVAGQTAFQYLYYGEILPNTYTLKLTGMPLTARIENGLRFVKPFLSVTAPILVLPALDVVFDFRKRKLLLLFIFFSALVYQVYVGGDPWNYWRMMSPAMPLVAILFVSALSALVLALSDTRFFSDYCLRNPVFPGRRMAGFLVVAMTVVGLLSANLRFLPEILFLEKPYTAESNRDNVNTAIVLNRLTTDSATVGVYWAGTIPYFTDRRAVDFLGKTDRYIAHLPPDVSGSVSWFCMKSVPGHNKYDLDYSIRKLQPTYVQGFQWGAQDVSQWAETRYVKVEHGGVGLFLLKDSSDVLWNKITAS